MGHDGEKRDIKVRIWDEPATPDSHVDMAVDVFNGDSYPELDGYLDHLMDINANHEGEGPQLSFESSHSAVLDTFSNWLDDNGHFPVPKDEYYLYIPNNQYIGAGHCYGSLGDNEDNNNNDLRGKGAIAFTNAYTRFSGYCYGESSGDELYRATLKHEFGHAFDLDHDDGYVRSYEENDTSRKYACSIMNLWYNGNACSGNSPPSSEICDNNWWKDEKISKVHQNYSDCSWDVMKDWLKEEW